MAAARRCQVLASPNVSPWFFARMYGFEGPEMRPTDRALWCTPGSSAWPAAEKTRKDPRPEEKQMPKRERCQLGIYYKVSLLDAGNVKSRGPRKAKRETPEMYV